MGAAKLDIVRGLCWKFYFTDMEKPGLNANVKWLLIKFFVKVKGQKKDIRMLC